MRRHRRRRVTPQARRGVFFAASAALLAMTASCSGPLPVENREVVPDTPMLSKVRLWIAPGDERGHATFYPGTGFSWRDLLLIDPCGPFHPGMTFEQAERRFGEPHESGQSARGPWVAYEQDGFRYVLGSYFSGSGNIVDYKWILQTHPPDDRVVAVFHPEVAAFLDGRRNEVTLMGGIDGPALHADLAGNRVLSLYPTAAAGCGA